MFFYEEDFNRIKNNDAMVAFAFELGLQAGLFFLTSGVSTIASFAHLRYLTKLRGLYLGAQGIEVSIALEDIIFAARVVIGIETASMTAGLAASYLNFSGTINDEPTKIRLSCYFAIFAFVSAGASIYARTKLVAIADDIINLTPTTVLLTFPQEVLNAIYQVTSKVAIKLAQAAEKLAEIDQAHNLGVLAKFENLTPALKYRFVDNFAEINIDDALNWGRIDDAFENWVALASRNIEESKMLDFITNQDYVNTIVDFYLQPLLRPNLEQGIDAVKRLAFIKKFRHITPVDFNEFVNNPEFIKHWFRFFDVDIVRIEFMELSNAKQLRLLGQYGASSDEVFEALQAGLIKYWSKVDDVPLDALVHADYIRRVDYLQAVKVAYNSVDKVETFIQHIKISLKTARYNGEELPWGYSGFHCDFMITEPLAITPTTTVIDGFSHMTGPLPTVSAQIQTAIKSGTLNPGTGMMDCEILLWGYARRNLGSGNNPIWDFVL